MIVRAPAKVNLVLRVGPVRDDGYHRLATLFQAIDVYDEIELAAPRRRWSRGSRTR